jgi:phosphoribosyl 1,2-cyclic phosphate phosphodiesterase
MLRAQVKNLDAVLLTHEHNDHIIGLDDLRPFIFQQQVAMPVYCVDRVARELQQRFAYAFLANPYPGAPRFELRPLDHHTPLRFQDLSIEAVEYFHGKLPVLGFRIEDFAYLTDFKSIAATELQKLQRLDTLVISALHHRPHHSHANLQEALAMIERCQPRRAFLTHLSHQMGLHAAIEQQLPAGVKLAYDGLQLEF